MPASDADERGMKTPAKTLRTSAVNDGLYDKLSQVSVSHRRVDSFEWVMTQSAPNTPPTTLNSGLKSFSPPPARLVESAPLPVPGELWSLSSSPRKEPPQKRGYFDWWPSPFAGTSTGYTKVPSVEDADEVVLQMHARDEAFTAEILRPLKPDDRTKAPVSSPFEIEQLRTPQELNALGIVFTDSPPHSPSISDVSESTQPSAPPKDLREAAPRVSKRVSFSPLIDEVVLETFPEHDYMSTPASHWGSYLPSSFLVARPPLTRTASSPVPRRTMAARPILKRSTSSMSHATEEATPSTEMIGLSRKIEFEDAIAVSPIPTQRLSAATLRTGGQRQVGETSDETDSVFVTALQAMSKSGRRRCDSLLSDGTSPMA
ncbi:hypothetical protein OPT61_g1365 [Boeremia exigua]|uniref:Uncharacterized protein n=1 Tax=Boeremia exigua TaxID=749465 RepID=A0ACC2IQI5_9PLEO|nr:hypothetical protein OPT61_g1365 [Boeremia exigua]